MFKNILTYILENKYCKFGLYGIILDTVEMALMEDVIMINEHDLRAEITKADLNYFKTEISFEDDIPNMIHLEENEIPELIRFAKANKISSLMYCYRYYDKEAYIIHEDALLKYDARIISAIEADIQQHNRQIDKLDFNKPLLLYVYSLYEGFAVSIIQEDFWLDEIDIPNNDERLDELTGKCKGLIEEIRNEKNKEKDDQKNKLRELIVSDPEFYKCTNQRLRRSFILKLLDDKDEFASAFDYYNEPIEFVELLWKEQKSIGCKI